MTTSVGALPLPDRRQTVLIAAISIIHGVSHYYHLLLAPLFPWLREDFGFSYAELGLLMSVFFVVSGIGQVLSGFLVDRVGPRSVLVVSLVLFVLACMVLASANGYPMLVTGAALAGLGNASFHPVDFSIINARIRQERLGKAYAMHGVCGSLGWALAPVMLTAVAAVGGWRMAFIVGMLPALLALMLCLPVWRELDTRPVRSAMGESSPVAIAPVTLAVLLRMPALWFSALYFFAIAIAFGAIQSFGAESVRLMREIDLAWSGYLLSIFMVGSAAGTLAGGYILTDPMRAERLLTQSFVVATLLALAIGFVPFAGWTMPLMFGLLGIANGMAGPARDTLVKRATPPGASGRVYGLVYSALDVGVAVSPAIFGLLMDLDMPSGVWLGVALAYGVLIVSAHLVGRTTRR